MPHSSTFLQNPSLSLSWWTFLACFRCKKPPSLAETPVSVVESKHHLQPHPSQQFQGFVDGEKLEARSMIGIKSFRSYHGDPMGGHNEATSSRCLYRHKSAYKCFPSMSSLSRNVSRKSRTATTSPVCESKSKRRDGERERESNDSLHTTPCTPKSVGDNLKTAPSPFSKNVSNRRIMYSNSSGMLKPPPIERDLECTLEELCYGCKKKINVTRQLPTDSGEIVEEEEEVITINVKPGWTRGTKIKFEGKGNERHGAYVEDLIYSISEKSHQLFRREGDDLELTLEIPLLKALTSSTISVPLLGGDHMDLTVDDIVHHGYEKIITGQGMPISKQPEKRGNLRITFLVHFPTQLTPHQRSELVTILQDCC